MPYNNSDYYERRYMVQQVIKSCFSRLINIGIILMVLKIFTG
jgi:hypothetical protein